MRTISVLFVFFVCILNGYTQDQDVSISNSDGVPVGTIVASLLKPYDFMISTRSKWPVVPSDKSSKWAPADGTIDVSGSKYYFITKNNSLPDLRGMFLRGLNSFNSIDTRNDGNEDPDGLNRKPGSIQNDNTKLENIYRTNVQAFYGIPSAPFGLQFGGDGPVPGPKLGDKESRPKNIAVYYYIKIN